jgi:hypothetical protein
MGERRSCYSPAEVWLSLLLMLVAMCGVAGPAEAQQTILAGLVSDDVTGRPIVGAEITVIHDAAVLGQGRTDPNGNYKVIFRRPSGVVTLAVRVDHEGYASRQVEFQSEDGRPFNPPPEIGLLSQALASCRGTGRHTIIIGNFRSPVGVEISALTDRIADGLRFDLSTRLQQNWIDPGLQPVIAPCTGARPEVPELGKRLAGALSADALVYGYVANTAAPFRVSTSVSDAYGLLPPTTTAHNPDVDLDDPVKTKMSDEAHAAILASLAGGIYKGDFTNCRQVVAILNAIEQLVSNPPSAVRSLRDQCTPHLQNSELLPDSGGGG